MSRHHPLQLDVLAVERLLAAETPDELDRVLIEVVCGTGLAPAAALWRRDGGRAGAADEWREVRSRGPRQLLPAETLVRAVLEGGLDERLPGGGHVLAACAGARRIALVLGPTPRDDDAQLASALLGLHATLVAAASGAATPTPPFGAPLPSERDDHDDQRPA